MDAIWRQLCWDQDNFGFPQFAASAATLAHACLTSAGYNVRINVNGLSDKNSGEGLLTQLQALEVRARKLEKDLHHTLIERGGMFTDK